MLKINDTVKVYLKNIDVIGVIERIEGENNDIIYIKSGNDTLKFYVGIDKIEVIPENLIQVETLETEIMNYINENEMDFDEYSHGNDTHIVVQGLTYSIDIYLEENLNTIALSTTHKDRYRSNEKEGTNYKAEGNEREVKTLKAVFNYIDKYYYY